MTKEDKIIRDLKKRNDSLLHQYDMTRIREIHYENKSARLEEENKRLKSVLKEIRELVESYNLGKYDYSIPPIGISDLLEIIDKAGESNEDKM